jgi:metal-sulfur cluster biosynthetic enzyme
VGFLVDVIIPFNPMQTLTAPDIYARLSTVIDPELGINIVKLGLIYKVEIKEVADPRTKLTQPFVHITMTLTTPGCPLSAVFDKMVRDSLFGLPGLNPDHNVHIELTFDPPWVPDMMDEEARAELGFD